jgi:cell division protease FtsH
MKLKIIYFIITALTIPLPTSPSFINTIFNTIKNSIYKIKLELTSPFIVKKESYKDITFKNIIGFDEQKKKLQEIIDDMKDEHNKESILIRGPSGMGKMTLIYAIANELNLPLLLIDIQDIQNTENWMMHALRDIFKFAKYNEPLIICIKNTPKVASRDTQEAIEFLKSYQKKLLNSLFIFHSENYMDLELMIHNNENRIIVCETLSEQDQLLLINHFLKINKITLQSNEVLTEYIKYTNGMTITQIEKNCLYLKKILHREYKTVATVSDIITLEKKHKNKKLPGNDTLIEIEEKPNITLNDIIEEKPNITLNDIAGYPAIKRKLLNMMPQLKNKNTKHRGILLSGHPGVGKSKIACALAGSAGIPIIKVDSAELNSLNGAEVAGAFDRIFQLAKSQAPCILFIDEIDSLLKNKTAATSFLIRLDGGEDLLGVTVIAASNYPEHLDPRIKRSGRLSLEINIPLPNRKDRIDIITYYLNKNNITCESNAIFEHIVENTTNMTGADIKEYISLMQEHMENNNITKINREIAFTIFIDKTLGLKKELSLDTTEEKQVAYHEAAHGLLQYALSQNNNSLFTFSFMTIEPRSDALGITMSTKGDDYKSFTKEKLEGEIKILLAGKAAQEIMLQTIDSGAENDLLKATDLAYSYVTKYAMLKKRLAVKGFFSRYDNETNVEIITDVELLLQKEYEWVKQFLIKHKELLDNITQKLLDQKMIIENELRIIVKTYLKKKKLNKLL